MDLSETEVLNRLASGEESPQRQEKLLLELRKVGTEASIPVLRSNVDAADARVRVGALRALAAVEGAGALDCLIEALKRDDATTTKWAASLIQRLGLEPEAVPQLIDVATERWDEHSLPRAVVVKALAPLRDARAIPIFRRGVTANDRRLRRQSALGLALLGTPEAQEILDGAVRELSWFRAATVRRVAGAGEGVDEPEARQDQQ